MGENAPKPDVQTRLVLQDQSWNCLNSEAGSEHWREIVYLSITHTNNNNNKKDTNNNKNSLRVKGSYIFILMKSVWKRIQFPHWFTPNPGIRWWQAGRQPFSKCCYLLAGFVLAACNLQCVCVCVCQKKKETKEEGNGSFIGGTMFISSQRLTR